MAAENPINKRRVNPGLTPLPGPVPISRLVLPDQNSLLEDDTLVGAYRTDLCLHQDRSATTIATYGRHLAAFRRWLADEYPDTSLPEVRGVHVKAYLLAEAGRGIAPATRSSALFALRSFYEYLRSEDLIDTNPTANIWVPGARKLRTEIYTERCGRSAGGVGGHVEHRLECRQIGPVGLGEGCAATGGGTLQERRSFPKVLGDGSGA